MLPCGVPERVPVPKDRDHRENPKRGKFTAGKVGRVCLVVNSPVEPSGEQERQHRKPGSWGCQWENMSWALTVGRQQRRGGKGGDMGTWNCVGSPGQRGDMERSWIGTNE